METQLEEESMSRLNMIILGLLLVVIVVIMIDVIFGGETGFVRSIVCGIIFYLPAGGLVSGYLECGGVPV